ncbi:hypothetical protein D6817_00775 [Candidatus Pacearchaeota archaeon]|nr:MAG: hypothetical protein D6817_00775 [Candidatus Pacearchaeota archaeon]
MTSKRGLFVVVDGLDVAGKGEGGVRALIEREQKLGKAVFDTIGFARAYAKGRPQVKDFYNPPHWLWHTIVTAEPSYTGTGQDFRERITSRENAKLGIYTVEEQIDAVSVDRSVQMREVVIPALLRGLNVIQSRCVASTLAYQVEAGVRAGKDERELLEKILAKDGTRLQLGEYRPDLLIIMTIEDQEEFRKRLESRELTSKSDNSAFERWSFQQALIARYKSQQMRELFESAGTRVAYINTTDMSLEETKAKVAEEYEKFLNSRQDFNR